MGILRQTKFSDFDFNIGSGTEYIVVGGDYLVFSASGILQRVSLVSPEKGAPNTWRIESQVEGEDYLLYEGTYTQADERFRLIKDRARRAPFGGQRTSFKSLLLVSLLTAVSACALVGLSNRQELRTSVSGNDQIDFSELVDAMKMSGMDYSHLLPSLADRSEMPPAALRQASREAITQVVPDLKPQGQDKLGGETAEATTGLPKYSPGLYNDDQRLPVSKADEAASTDTNSSVPVSEPAALSEEIKAELNKLSPDQASEALRKISMLTPGQMKGDALASLPDSLRELIEKTAMDESQETRPTPGIDTTDEQGVPTKLIILPPKVIDDYRTHDGISSIPENSSWQARGNPTVHLPLPGGGDIQTVSDLEKFGLKP